MKKRRPSKLWILSLILTLVITSLPAGVLADTGIPANVQTSADQSSQPGTDQPGQSGTEQPDQPSEPGTDQPGTDQPGQSGTEQPGQSGTDQPENPVVSPSAIPAANLLITDNTSVNIKIISNVNIDKLEIINSQDEIIRTLSGDFDDFVDTTCPKGDYTYNAYLKGNRLAGTGGFTVTEDGQRIYLSYVQIHNNSVLSGSNVPIEVKLTDDQGHEIQPGRTVLSSDHSNVISLVSYVVPALTDDSGSRPYYLTAAIKGEEYSENYAVSLKQVNPISEHKEFTIDTPKIDLKKGNEWTFDDNSFEAGITVAEMHPVQFKVPHGAGMQFHPGGPAAYVPYKEWTPQIEEGSPYDTYTFKMPADTNVRYEAGGGDSPYLKQVQTFSIPSKYFDNGSIPKFTLDLKKKSERRDPLKLGYEEDNLYLNVPDSNYIKLNEGGSFDIEGFRVWQTAEGSVSNQFVEPDYHYDMIAGADNIALTKTGKPGREYMTVTGKKTGISVIRITYDPMRVMGSEVKQENGALSLSTDEREYWNAIDPVNTRVVVVNVGGNNAANIETNIAQTEYDTIYFDQDQTDHADFTFTPTANAEIKVRVHDPLYNSQTEQWIGWDDKTAWSDYKPNESGAFTVHLKNGRNIIEVSAGSSVEYYVVNAKALKIKTENHTNPGKPLKVGDTEYISFDGLTQPVQKMTAVYNPGWGGTCWVQYEDQDNPNRIFSSEGVQYNLIDENTIAVTPSQPGQLHLVNGRIHAGWMGSPLDAHREISPDGLLPNLNASGNDRFFSTLPDITLNVQSGADEKELNKTFFAQLSQIALAGGGMDVLASTWKQPTNALWDTLGDNRNKFVYAGFGNGSTIDLNVSALNAENLNIQLYSDQEGEWKEITSSDQGKSFQILLDKQKESVDLELRAAPKNEKDGYPQTYAIMLQDPSAKNPNPFLANLKIVPQTGTKDMGYLDGQLKAVSGEGTDLNLGYGFLPTRNHFKTEVPYQVSEITLKTLIPRNYSAQSISWTADGSEPQTLPLAGYEAESAPISLKAGHNTIQVTARSTLDKGTSAIYTIDVTRSAAPPLYTFTNRKEGAKLTVKSDRGYVMEPEDGKTDEFRLNPGTYTYYYSQPGFVTQTETFTVEDQAGSIALADLVPLTQTDGTVTVQITSPNTILRGKTSIAYTVNGAKDLAVNGYVDYNHGGYTALHALLEACDTGTNKIPFTCIQGNLKLSDIKVPADAGPGAGWVCEINGTVCTDPANTLVKDGDQIVYYYNADYAGMQRAFFEQDNAVVTEGQPASVKLLGTPVKNNGTAAAPIAGASVKINGQALGGTEGITGADGTVIIPSSKIANPGVYMVTAEKTEQGHNVLTYCQSMITVKKADVPVTPGQTTVRFRLIGDAKHGSFATHEKYVTWIATKSYTFDSDSVSVYDVFTRALNDAGLAYVGADKNYVSKIKAPKAYGDYWLGEFDNGPNSGWMYTVNGVHPQFGLKDFKVTNGDSIVWHYVDDYKKETSFNGSHPEYENRWLEAPDVNPPTDGTIIDMSQGNPGADPNAATATVAAEAKTDDSGKASVSVSADDLSKALKTALEQAEKNKKDLALVRIDVKADSNAKTVETTLPVSGWKEIQKAGNALLSVKTPIGELKFDQNALTAAAKEMEGQNVTLTIEKTDVTALPENMRSGVSETVGNRPLYQLSLKSGEKALSNFANGTVTVTLPYELQKDEKPEGVCVYYIDDNGTAQLISDSQYPSQSKTVQFTTNHFSWYGIGYSEARAKGLTGIARFTDVSLNDWFAASVSQLVDLGIIKGKTDTEFAPQDNVTRAEFAQILYGMAQKASQTTGSAISGAVIQGEGAKAAEAFADVKGDAWYAESVAWAHDAGIIAGYQNGDGTQSFAPDTKISRQDMAVMLMNYTTQIRKKELPKIKASLDFVDQDQISPYASQAVTLMQRAGVISGKVMADQTLFAPKDSATRAEAAQMVASYINLR